MLIKEENMGSVLFDISSFTFIFHTAQFGREEQGSSEARIWHFKFRYS